MKKSFVFIATFLASSVSLAAHAEGESRDFKGVLQCRTMEDSSQRLACYDNSISPTRTKSAKKFESRDQCPDEKTDEGRLTCYDRFFAPTFKPASSVKTEPSDAEAGKKEMISREELLGCRSEVNGTKRLACYDQLLPPNENELQAPKEEADSGKWQVSTVTSDIDDSTNVFVMQTADLPISSNFGRTSTPLLFITCREKKTELFINWDVYLGLGETSMLHRLDKQKAVSRAWTISGNTKAVFYRGRTIDFIKSLEKAEKMLVQITPYNENSVTTTFDLKGLSEAIKPLQKSCGWKEPQTESHGQPWLFLSMWSICGHF